MNKALRRVLEIAVLLLGIGLVLFALKAREETPYVEKGRTLVTTDAEAYARRARVYGAAATDAYIFLSHGQSGVISAFGRDGAYRFTIVTTADGNGAPELYCVGERLVLIDKNKHVFVYEGSALLEDRQLGSLEEGSRLREELRESGNPPVSLRGGEVIDAEGAVILSGLRSGEQYTRRTLLLVALSIPALFVVWLVRRRKDPSLREAMTV